MTFCLVMGDPQQNGGVERLTQEPHSTRRERGAHSVRLWNSSSRKFSLSLSLLETEKLLLRKNKRRSAKAIKWFVTQRKIWEDMAQVSNVFFSSIFHFQLLTPQPPSFAYPPSKASGDHLRYQLLHFETVGRKDKNSNLPTVEYIPFHLLFDSLFNWN